MTASLDDLLLIVISICPRDVEALLDSLAHLPHYINPTLRYEENRTAVEFPAYRAWLPEIRAAVPPHRFNDAKIEIHAAVKELSLTAGHKVKP